MIVVGYITVSVWFIIQCRRHNFDFGPVDLSPKASVRFSCGWWIGYPSQRDTHKGDLGLTCFCQEQSRLKDQVRKACSHEVNHSKSSLFSLASPCVKKPIAFNIV
jgi:hypothetical protein